MPPNREACASCNQDWQNQTKQCRVLSQEGVVLVGKQVNEAVKHHFYIKDNTVMKKKKGEWKISLYRRC